MDRLRIQNFAGIKDMEFEFKSITVLIGPQATGKSVAIKLLYFFKTYLRSILDSIVNGQAFLEFEKSQNERFMDCFPLETWSTKKFIFTYTADDFQIVIHRKKGIAVIQLSKNLQDFIYVLRQIKESEPSFSPDHEQFNLNLKNRIKVNLVNHFYKTFSNTNQGSQFFIPAGRSFFANFQKSLFAILQVRKNLDPFLVGFGSLYEEAKDIYNKTRHYQENNFVIDSFNDVIHSNYKGERDDDYLIHTDDRSVNITNASSGQQETLPLMIILSVLIKLKFPEGATIYIEEPEAHLFPIAQKRIIHLLAKVFNSKDSKFQIIVTTHSPYVLASFNNLIQAGNLTIIKPKKAKAIASIIVKEEQIPPNAFAAYSLNNGELESLVDPETQLISQTVLDSVSNEIAKEFDSLLDLEF